MRLHWVQKVWELPPARSSWSAHTARRDPGQHCLVLSVGQGAQGPECLDGGGARYSGCGVWGWIEMDHIGRATVVVCRTKE